MTSVSERQAKAPGTDSALPCDPHAVAVDDFVEQLERVVGPLTLYQAIDVRRIVDECCDVYPRR